MLLMVQPDVLSSYSTEDLCQNITMHGLRNLCSVWQGVRSHCLTQHIHAPMYATMPVHSMYCDRPRHNAVQALAA